MFTRDAVLIREEAQKSSEVMARAIIFAILTANAPLRASVNAALWIRAQGNRFPTLSYADLTLADKSYMGAAMTSRKLAWAQHVWATREELFARYKSMDAISFWELLLDTVPGLGLVKAAFAVQMLYNKLGCLDVHNLRELGVTRTAVSGKTANKRAGYLNLQAVKSSEAWWSQWCDFIAAKYPGQFDSGDYVSRLHAIAVVGV